MKTLFLGSYGFGNLGDELCLIEAMQAFPSDEAWAFSNDARFTSHSVPGVKGYITDREQIRDLKPQRVVLGGGGVGFFPSIRDMLHWMDDAFRIGAECHIHNIGVAWIEDRSWVEAVQVQRVLKGLASISVRDHLSWFCTKSWPIELHPKITLYPERNLPADPALVAQLPKGRPLLGVSVTGQGLMRRALAGNAQKVRDKLALYPNHLVIPVISTISPKDPEEDDVAGFNYFRKLFLADRDVACEQFLDGTWWNREMTPLRLKGIIGGLDVIFTQRKHNLIHAIGTQTAAVGTFPSIDDSIARIFFSLRDFIPPLSSQLCLIVRSGE